MVIATMACACSRTHDPEIRAEPDVGPAHPHDTVAPAPAPSPSEGPWMLDRDLKLTKHASVILPHGMVVTNGARLTIEQGVTLAFAAGSVLRVREGTIVAHGTAADPILFTSDATPKRDADWIGVVIEDQKGAGSVLDGVIIEYAGKGPDPAALKVIGVAAITLGAITMRHDDGAGLSMVPIPP